MAVKKTLIIPKDNNEAQELKSRYNNEQFNLSEKKNNSSEEYHESIDDEARIYYSYFLLYDFTAKKYDPEFDSYSGLNDLLKTLDMAIEAAIFNETKSEIKKVIDFVKSHSYFYEK
ncbi:hypothetical protein [Spiroplasma culicicola]|uniref:Uncharacterized protein n=1 Tax=Spiroplasma culicicola AES-1 TaxID=1276246 RepID=W6AGG4_9MOLU|nr:hypothetical protein [Spiroplasma culicicola]AHI52764.1 hypothetical protein SCULI_v1c04230 [Spiroplasma culicicola AES-1]